MKRVHLFILAVILVFIQSNAKLIEDINTFKAISDMMANMDHATYVLIRKDNCQNCDGAGQAVK